MAERAIGELRGHDLPSRQADPVRCRADGKLWIFNRSIGRCLGLAVRGSELWVTADIQILKLVNAFEPGQRSSEGYDALYVPQVAYFTGNLDAHDLAASDSGETAFTNTQLNCLARMITTPSFVSI